MSRRRPSLLLLLLALLANCAICKSLPVTPSEVTVGPDPFLSAHATGDPPIIDTTTPQSEITPQGDSQLSGQKQSNITRENPIKNLVRDLGHLYTAIQGFVSPWFESSVPEVTKNVENVTKFEESSVVSEPEFDDFEDPGSEHEAGESESRPARVVTDMLRYARDMILAPRQGDLVRTLLRHVRDLAEGNHTVSQLVNTLLWDVQGNPTDVAKPLLRHAREVMLAPRQEGIFATLLRHVRDLAEGNLTASGFVNTLLRNVESSPTGVAKSILRHVRDVAEGRQNIFQGYYDFVINEYSYKFWAVYMLFAAGLLTYSAIAAIYFSKFNTSAIDYELYDDFARSNHGPPAAPVNGTNPVGLVGSLVSVRAFQQIMDAISSKKYS